MNTAYPIAKELSVAETVLSYSACAAVFQRHKIDFCCKGNVSIEQAADDKGIDLALLLTDLDDAIHHRSPTALDARSLSTPALIAHIISKHHTYLREAIPFILRLSDKVARVHGAHEPRLLDLDQATRKIAAALLPHLDEEETVLFPHLMAAAAIDPTVIADELTSMLDDHLEVGALLAEIRQLTDDFTPPDWGCTSFRTLYAELHTLESDTLTHVHLENHALMPRFVTVPTTTRNAA